MSSLPASLISLLSMNRSEVSFLNFRLVLQKPSLEWYRHRFESGRLSTISSMLLESERRMLNGPKPQVS